MVVSLGNIIDIGAFALPQTQRAKILQYADLVRKWNRVHNLVSRSSLKELETILIPDAIAASTIIRTFVEGKPYVLGGAWTDLGSGNGMPGIIFAILNPHWMVDLIEAQKKRVAFLNAAASSLELSNCKAWGGRIEELIAPFRVGFSRALGTMDEVIGLVDRLAVPGALLFHLKGDASDVPLCSTWNTSIIGTYTLGEERRERKVLVSQKL